MNKNESYEILNRIFSLIFGFIGSLAIPCYYFAGRRYAGDKANLETSV